MKTSIGILICVIALWGAIITGWVMNIVAIAGIASSDGELTTMFILRCAGVLLFPLGAILGFC